MPQTLRELEVNLASFDTVAMVGSRSIPGILNVPQAEDLLVEGVSPEFTALLHQLRDAGVTIGTTIDSITNQLGETRGPYRVVKWMSQADGTFVDLGLEQR